jgi:rhodanese-related sulfurtransferase
VGRIDVPALRERMHDDPELQVLDVRERAEWDRGHIPGSVSTPYHDIGSVPEGLDPANPIAVICSSGERSGVAASLLLRHGARTSCTWSTAASARGRTTAGRSGTAPEESAGRCRSWGRREDGTGLSSSVAVDLNVVCKNCGSEVSPYITECPYCGQRLRKRAPKLRQDGEGVELAPAPKRRGAAAGGARPTSRRCRGCRGAARGDHDRAGSAALLLVERASNLGLYDLGAVIGLARRRLVAPERRSSSTRTRLPSGGVAVAIFGTSLERRYGPLVMLACSLSGAAGMYSRSRPPTSHWRWAGTRPRSACCARGSSAISRPARWRRPGNRPIGVVPRSRPCCSAMPILETTADPGRSHRRRRGPLPGAAAERS